MQWLNITYAKMLGKQIQITLLINILTYVKMYRRHMQIALLINRSIGNVSWLYLDLLYFINILDNINN